MPRALIIEFSLCGVGHDAGPPRTIRLGFVHVSVVPRGFVESVRRQSRALVACRRVIWLICQRVATASKAASADASPVISIDRDLAAEMDQATTEIHQATPAQTFAQRYCRDLEGLDHE